VLSPGDGRRELTVARAEVRIPAVRGRIRHSDGETIGYVQLFTFSQGTHADLRKEIERLVGRGAEGVVLDLRGNGGGLLDEAVLGASVFVEDGPIVITEGRSQPREVYDAVGEALPARPMAVLIDGDTASAAEILAAALEDYGLATLVGTRTYGKGTFQEVIELSNGGGLNLTVGEYLTSEEVSLAGKGIPPQVRVPADREGKRDLALRRALGLVAAELP
jgi:carboxyl-terminal processing protease